MTAVAYRGGRVLADGVARREYYVSVEDDVIIAVGPEPAPGATVTDLGDVDLVPGLVDLHSDCWNERAHPRPTCALPLDQALVALDTEAVSNGITTHFVCVALEDNDVKQRSLERARRCVEVLTESRPTLRADHRIHIRFEVTGRAVDVVRELAETPAVGLLSYMDHTPGHGQYSSEDEWREYYLRDGNNAEQVESLLAKRRERQHTTDTTRVAVAAIAHDRHVALASHDDDTMASIDRAVRLGAGIAEFPVTAEAAKAAVAAGLATVMGAPNARRGASHLAGNLSVREAVALGCLDVLASDYHPPSLLTAVYVLADTSQCSWPDAMALVTAKPAAAVGLDDRGRLAVGQRADLLAVQRRAGVPTVVQAWVAGRPCFGR